MYNFSKKLTLLHQSKNWFSWWPVPGLVLWKLIQYLCGVNAVACNCWTVSVQADSNHPDPAGIYHGPPGAGSSTRVSLRVPWYNWGCVKFSLCVGLTQLLILWVLQSRVGVCCLGHCVCVHPGVEPFVLKIPLMDYYFLHTPDLSAYYFCSCFFFFVHRNSGLWPS